MSRYLFEMNLGYTGSERFAPSNRFGFFPSAAVGYMISEEKFFKNIFKNVNKLKMRYSYGIVGSDAASDRWLYKSDFVKSGSSITEGKIPNLQAQWEQAIKQDLGIELDFDVAKTNNFSLTLDLFNEHRSKMLLVPHTNDMVANSYKALNLGSIKKHGCEVELQYTKKTLKDLRYYIKAMASFSENRILNKDDYPYAPEYTKAAGKPYGGVNGCIALDDGYFSTIDEIHNSVTPVMPSELTTGQYVYLDYNCDGVIDNNDIFSLKGSSYAPIIASCGGGLSYKNFTFSFLFAGNFNKYIDYGIFDSQSGKPLMHKSLLNYWTPVNQNSNHSTLVNPGTSGIANESWASGLRLEGRQWRKADFVRLKDVYISYKFNNNKLSKIAGLNSVELYMTLSNILTFTGLLEGDPEAKAFTSEGYYPQMASGNLGFKISF